MLYDIFNFLAIFSNGKPSFLRTRIDWWVSEESNFSGYFETIIVSLNDDTSDTQENIASLINKTVFSCADMIARGLSNDQLAC